MPTALVTDILPTIPRSEAGHAAIGHRPKPERREFLMREFYAATNGNCTVCGEAIRIDADFKDDDRAVIMHIVPSGPNKLGWIAGNLMIGCNACNKADKGQDLTQFVDRFALGHTILTEWRAGNYYPTRSDIAANRRAIRQRLGLPY